MGSKVSARVPDELRYRVDGMLAEMGSNTTQLINAAYEYVLKTGKLPVCEEGRTERSASLSEQQQAELSRRIQGTTYEVPESYFADKSYDEILEEELYEAYASLA